MTTKELQESVLSKRKNLFRGRAYFYLNLLETVIVGVPILKKLRKFLFLLLTVLSIISVLA